MLTTNEALELVYAHKDGHSEEVARYEELQQFLRGVQPLPYVPDQAADEYVGLMKRATTPFARLVIRTVVERIQLSGWRAENMDFGEDIWGWWVANGLPSRINQAFWETCAYGVSFLELWPAPRNGTPGTPGIFPVSPWRMHAFFDPEDMETVRSACKFWSDQDGDHALLYYEDGVYRINLNDRSGVGFPNPLGVDVPVVALRNAPQLDGSYSSDLDNGVTNVLSRIDKYVSDSLLLSNFVSFRVRYVTGWEPEIDEETGQPKAPMQIGADRLIWFENPEARAGTFTEDNLSQYTSLIDEEVKNLAVITATPPTALLGDLIQLSAEALLAAESGLVAKTRSKQTDMENPLANAVRMAARLVGRNDIADDRAISPLWGDIAFRNPAVLADVATKMRSIGIPLSVVLTDVFGYTPIEAEQIVKKGREESMTAMLAQQKFMEETGIAPGQQTVEEKPDTSGGVPGSGGAGVARASQ